jgi:hypothetical protein
MGPQGMAVAIMNISIHPPSLHLPNIKADAFSFIFVSEVLGLEK